MARPNWSAPEDWARIDRIFTRALDLPPERWPAFLDEACGGEAEVRSRVAYLLRLSLALGDFLETPYPEARPEHVVRLTALKTRGPWSVLRTRRRKAVVALAALFLLAAVMAAVMAALRAMSHG